MGMVTALPRVAVVILAVVDSPGRRLGGGSLTVTTTLKSLASWLPVVVWVVARPVERTTALLPISVTSPCITFLGIASMVKSAYWPSFTLTMSVSSTMTSAVTTDISETVMRRLPGEL